MWRVLFLVTLLAGVWLPHPLQLSSKNISMHGQEDLDHSNIYFDNFVNARIVTLQRMYPGISLGLILAKTAVRGTTLVSGFGFVSIHFWEPTRQRNGITHVLVHVTGKRWSEPTFPSSLGTIRRPWGVNSRYLTLQQAFSIMEMGGCHFPWSSITMHSVEDETRGMDEQVVYDFYGEDGDQDIHIYVGAQSGLIYAMAPAKGNMSISARGDLALSTIYFDNFVTSRIVELRRMYSHLRLNGIIAHTRKAGSTNPGDYESVSILFYNDATSIIGTTYTTATGKTVVDAEPQTRKRSIPPPVESRCSIHHLQPSDEDRRGSGLLFPEENCLDGHQRGSGSGNA